MMTSEPILNKRPTRIDRLMLPDHEYLKEEDYCNFFGEYTAQVGYEYSQTNSLILNFKNSLDRPKDELKYKVSAISDIAKIFENAIKFGKIDRMTFVPIPPSKAEGDSLYDDRIFQMLSQVNTQPPLDV